MSDPITMLLSGRRGHFKMESGYPSEFWYDLDALFAQVAFRIWPPADCPHCRAGRPLEEVSA